MKPAIVSAYLAFGSNLGDPATLLRAGRDALGALPGVEVTAWSNLYRSSAVGGPTGQPDYLNAVVALRTALPARALLDHGLAIEAACGRVRTEVWGPRTLDIDLLLYGDAVIDEPSLIVPHPLLAERRFVLAPLAELAPDLLLPVHGKTARQLLAALTAAPPVFRLSQAW